jgi:hypothetical protein
MTEKKQPVNKRKAVRLNPETEAMLAEMGKALYPDQGYTTSVLINALIRERYARFKREQARKAGEQES